MLGFVVQLRPANPGWAVPVCVFVCAFRLFPPILAGICGARVWVRTLAFSLPFLVGGLGPVCLCMRSTCNLPVLAGVCGVGGCVWVRVSPTPSQYWLGCSGVCVCVRAACTLPVLAGISGVCVLVWVLAFTPPLLAWMLGRVCLCALSNCTLPVLAGVCGVGGCVWVRVSATLSQYWMGCSGVSVCVRAACMPPVLAGVCGVCVWVRVLAFIPPLLAEVLGPSCLCARSACTLPVLAGVCGAGVCAWVRVPAAPCHSWLGCWGSGLVVAWHLLPCRCSLPVVRPSRVCGTRAAPSGRCCLTPVRVPWLWPAAYLSGVPRGPTWCAAPRPVRSLSVLQLAFPTPWCLPTPPGAFMRRFTRRLRGARGGGPRTGLIVLAAGHRRGRGAGLAPRGTRLGPPIGFSLAGPSRVSLGLPALRWFDVCAPGH